MKIAKTLKSFPKDGALLQYEPSHTFGTICTSSSNTLWTPSPSTRNTSAGRAYVPANQAILTWDIKTSTLLSTWQDANSNSTNATSSTRIVTSLAQCRAQPDLFAAGYSDGAITIWDALSGQVVVRFDGHRSAVTHLAFDAGGERLASGSRDTDVILWDLVGERAEGRLRGHRGEITGLSFLRTGDDGQERFLLTTSKDALVKVWDLEGKFCRETHVAQESGECWALGVSAEGDGCITAGSDGELKVWGIDLDALASDGSNNHEPLENGMQTEGKVLTSRGILHRQGNKDRTVGITFHPKQDYIAIHGADKVVEIWRIRSDEELHRHMQRKRRRRREKAASAGETLPIEKTDVPEPPEVSDVFVPHLIVRTGGRVRSVAWMAGKSSNKSLQILVACTNNLLETYNVSTTPGSTQSKDTTAPDYTRALSLDLPGHRTDVRTLALSSDDRMLASASAGELKIWNLHTRSCLRTLECGQALCSAFLPGDRIVLLGTKEGMLEVWDISSSNLIERIQAHGNEDGGGQGVAVWSMALHPDGTSVVTGSQDKSVKFWRFDVIDEEIPGTLRTTQRLKLTQTRHLKLQDDILGLAFSPDARLLAVSTLDNTVKVFFTDSLKLFLTLYGHKLPVLDLSISSDSTLLATSSADKNVRIWGLDFGDCHKSFFAHSDSVMSVRFIPHPVEQDERHILFSAGKDGVLRTWDAAKLVPVQRLEGHAGEVWAMAVGRTGEMIVTAGHDRSLRIWEVGDDQVFLEEEREREMEAVYEEGLARGLERDDLEGEEEGEEVAAVGKQTIATLTHGEKILEALELCTQDLQLQQAYTQEKANNPNAAPPQRNPLFLALGNISAEQHLLTTFQKIPSSSLNDSLLLLPFSSLPNLLTFLALFMRQRMAPQLSWRITYFLLKVHMKSIVASASPELERLLQDIWEGYGAWVEEERKVVGFNLVGLEILGGEVGEDEKGAGGYLDGVDGEEDAGKGRARRKRVFANLA